MIRRPPRSPLVPKTTLFRSGAGQRHDLVAVPRVVDLVADLGLGRLSGQHQVRSPDEIIPLRPLEDRKSTRLNSSHANMSYAVFCLKKQTYPSPLCLHAPFSP